MLRPSPKDCASDLLLETLRLCPTRSAAELRQAWRETRTDGLPQLVAFEGCSLWLYRRLQELGVVADVDAAFAAWLAQSARRITAHNLAVGTQRDVVVSILNDLGCPHVLLKGAAGELVSDVYPYADARAIGDVDVLLPSDLASATWQRLRSAGFDPAPDAEQKYASHYHLAPLSNGRRVSVELHTSTSKALAPAEAWRRITADAHVVERATGITRVPAPTERLWHALGHALVGSSSYGFRLRFLLDAAVVSTSGRHVDWRAVASRLDAGELPDATAARRWLGAAAWLAGTPCPAEVTRGIAAFDLTRALRWRLQVFRRSERLHLVAEQGLWATDAGARARRLLINEGTRSALGWPLTPARRASGALVRSGRWAAAAVARLCFWGWRAARRT
ncbi:MAG: nucleotidyltransferase family protein [Chloroflexi bacterium]|nr:MAG: nucleotidyltransferase family protein [Chloroflexota bacterium]